MKYIFFLLSLHILFSISVLAAPQAEIHVTEPSYYSYDRYFPDIGYALTRGIAPYPIFFNGWRSTPREEIISYEWDFGPGTENDPEGRYFQGFNAAHVFETPGTYTVTLTVTEFDGEQSSDQITVEILPRDGETFYVDSEIGHDDNYDGKCPMVQETCGPWRTATKAFENVLRPRPFAPQSEWIYQPGDKILFKRGQTFILDRGFSVGHGWGTQGYSFQACNDECGNPNDPKPIIQWEGSNGFVFSYGHGTAYISFIDLVFNLNGQNGQATGIFHASEAFKNLLLLRSEFYDPQNGMWQFEGATDKPPTGIFMFQNHVSQPETVAIATTQMYGGPNDLAMLGNTFDWSGNHIAYLATANATLIDNNIFSRPASGRTAVRFLGGPLHDPTSHVQISRNHFLGWVDNFTEGSGLGGAHGSSTTRYNYLLVEIGTLADGDEHSFENVLIERNIFTNCEKCVAVANARDVTIRNNIFVTAADFTDLINLGTIRRGDGTITPIESRPLENVNVLGNTIIHNPSNPLPWENSMVSIYPFSPRIANDDRTHTNINIKNNIFWAGSTITPDAIKFFDNTIPLNEFDINNNIYSVSTTQPFLVGNTRYSFADWQSQFNKDQNSYSQAVLTDFPLEHFGPGQPTSQQIAVQQANGYIQYLQAQTNFFGIDRGTLANALFFDDYFGNTRVGATDIGAVEFQNDNEEPPQECLNDFDNNPCDGSINIAEVLDAVTAWKNNELDLADLLNIIAVWKGR